MSLNKQKGNMYPKVKTRNFLGGECPYKCEYCYTKSLKRFPAIKKRYSGEPLLLWDELAKKEGKGHTIFVCSCIDMMAKSVFNMEIDIILRHLCDYPDNVYLLQSKNPERFLEFLGKLPPKVILGTTIETNQDWYIDHGISKAPPPKQRAFDLSRISIIGNDPLGMEKMVSLEPIMELFRLY